MMSGTAPDLTDYNGWHARAFRQYEGFAHAPAGNPPARLPAAFPQLHAAGVFPAPVPVHAQILFAPLPGPVLPAVVPMDIDRTRTGAFPRTCFRCGAARHLARECLVTSDVRHMDILNKVVCQLGDDPLDKLFTRLSTTTSCLASGTRPTKRLHPST
jgi:hypothetical protein